MLTPVPSPAARKTLDKLARKPHEQLSKQVAAQLYKLRAGQDGMRTHPYTDYPSLGIVRLLPGPVMQSYVSQSGGAWRIWWQRDETTLYILLVGAHPT